MLCVGLCVGWLGVVCRQGKTIRTLENEKKTIKS